MFIFRIDLCPESRGLMEEDANLMLHPEHVTWRAQILQGMLWVSTIIGVPAVVYMLATTSRGLTRPATLAAIILAAVAILVACSRRWLFDLRAVIFIGVAYTGGLLSVLYFGFSLGSGLLMLLVVVVCGFFFGSAWLWIGLLLTSASLASVGVLHSTGVIATQRLELLDMSQGQNVVRVTLAYLVLAGAIALSVFYIVRCLERSLHETSAVLARYTAERLGRSEAEAALQESEETYRHLVENINDVIYATDAKGIITYISPAVEAQSGYSPSELIGRVFFEFVDDADRDRLINEFAITLSGHLEPSEFRVVMKSGEVRWIRSSSRPIYQDGRVVGLRGVYIDTTEKRELEEQLRQAYKMNAMGTLAGGIAHEFNNILAVILGFTELAQYETLDDSVAHANLDQVLKAGYRAKELVQQILAFSRQSNPTRAPLSIAKVVEDVCTLLRASLPATIDLRLRMHEETGTILANETQLHQVLMNLCANAKHAMRETGGILEIGVAPIDVTRVDGVSHGDLCPGPWVRCTVRDTGRGMSADIANHIFDPFFTTKGIGEGTGMGLAIVHGIVAAHRGTIEVESRLGEGTTFTLHLPRCAETVAAEASMSTGICPPEWTT